MSDLQGVGRLVAQTGSDADRDAAVIGSLAGELRRNAAMVQQLLASSARTDYRDILRYFDAAEKSLNYASACLLAASRSAESWLGQHVRGGAGTVSVFRTSGMETQQIDLSDRPSGGSSEIVDSLERAGIGYQPLRPLERDMTAEEIISRVGGGDMTQGSCSSLAFAYVGNVAGFDVLDFRDGESRKFFAKNGSIEKIANLPGVESFIVSGGNDISCVHRLFNMMEPGKEYYLATGQHAAIVRMKENGFEYLELQHPTDNGWHMLSDFTLLTRFGCTESNGCNVPNFLIEVASLSNSPEFLAILGYLNTAEPDQNKGENGYVR